MQIKIYAYSSGREPFTEWLMSLADLKVRAAIQKRLNRIQQSNHLGDYKYIDSDLIELRFFLGPGYRVYCGIQEQTLMILLTGGDKSSQKKDIAQAKQFWSEYRQ